MNESTHTPGPWIAKQEFANRWRVAQVTDGFIPLSVAVVTTTRLEAGCPAGSIEADARLIAAAPDLHAVLAEIDEYLSEPNHANYVGAGSILHRRVKAALAKARGVEAPAQ